MTLAQTIIPQNYINKINDARFDWDVDEVPNFYAIITMAMSKLLAKAKSTEYPVAAIINDEGGKFVMGAQVEVHANKEEKDNPGNWSYVMTFNESDITAAKDHQFTLSDSELMSMVEVVSYDAYRYMFNTQAAKTIMMQDTMLVLRDYLDKNAKEEEEVTVELEGYFQAAVAIENGEKVMSITPDGAMKTIIKEDAKIEK